MIYNQEISREIIISYIFINEKIHYSKIIIYPNTLSCKKISIWMEKKIKLVIEKLLNNGLIPRNHLFWIINIIDIDINGIKIGEMK